MVSRIRQRVCAIAAIVVVSGLIGGLGAQRRAPEPGAPRQAISVSLKVGGQAYESREPGRCTHAPAAAIHSIRSEMWNLEQSAEGRSLALTLWKPNDGSAEMVTLSVRTGSSSHEINTVRGGGPTSGSGKVALDNAGKGGTFTIDARTKDGTTIGGTIKCDVFAPHVAEGGL